MTDSPRVSEAPAAGDAASTPAAALNRADTNRATFPHLAAIVDAFRRTFGPGVRLLHGIEDGRELAKRPAWWADPDAAPDPDSPATRPRDQPRT